MALNEKTIADSVVGELDRMGINSKVGPNESNTALLVRSIIKHVVQAIKDDAEIVVTQVETRGVGNMGAPVISSLMKPGKGIIK